MKKIYTKQNKGFVIFIAVVVTSILVLISLLVSNISLRQLTFSFAGKNSQIAFVTANSGIECALFWDLNNSTNPGVSAFATSSSVTAIAQNISCNGQSFTFDASNNHYGTPGSSSYESDLNNGYLLLEKKADVVSGGTITEYGAATTTFRISYQNQTPSLPYCTDVVVAKWKDAGGNQEITIESRGHNPCDSGPKQVERAIRVKYP